MSLKEDLLRLLMSDAEFRKQLGELLGINLQESLDRLTISVDRLVKNQEVLQQTVAELSRRVDQLTKNQEVLQQT
ncbi:hypothetical protein, partial [Metallosphaera javensis (ex Hofmann et al. 2022)]|uniref:hypothetical protein n=1 Tax=Metallosphaera javensis (ex Hofmann et al. 2022) TaxID=99938 RepID=UPI003D160EA8